MRTRILLLLFGEGLLNLAHVEQLGTLLGLGGNVVLELLEELLHLFLLGVDHLLLELLRLRLVLLHPRVPDLVELVELLELVLLHLEFLGG